jgi:hypothetical protein
VTLLLDSFLSLCNIMAKPKLLKRFRLMEHKSQGSREFANLAKNNAVIVSYCFSSRPDETVPAREAIHPFTRLSG